MRRGRKHESPIILQRIPAFELVIPTEIKCIANGERIIVQTGPEEIGEVCIPKEQKQNSENFKSHRLPKRREQFQTEEGEKTANGTGGQKPSDTAMEKNKCPKIKPLY